MPWVTQVGSRGIALTAVYLGARGGGGGVDGWKMPRSGLLTPEKRTATLGREGCMNLGAGTYWCGKSRTNRDSISGPSRP
jgi:hypothetical protein